MEDLINRLKNSDLKFIEKQTKIPYDRMYKWIKGKSKPKTDDYSTLLKYFHELDKGNGNISINSVNEPNFDYRSPRLEAKPLRLADPYGFEATGDKIYELNDGSLMMEVPVITQRAYAGYLRGFADPEFFEDIATVPVMIDRKAFGTYMAFEVYGDSMVCLNTYELAEKSIFPGRIAIGRLLDQSKWQYKLHTHNYDAWIIVHRTEGILIKTISKHDVEKGVITAHSLNPTYPDQDLNLSDVEQIFSVVKIEQKKR